MKSERKLVAIMFTDIVGYTMMMGKDSNKTLEFLRMNRHNQKLLVEKHNGSFLKEMGDGTMASFQSALDAVLCAVEIQESLTKEDYKLRIGIHSGDIVAEEGEIYGDGINIASRIQSVCDPGGIYITEPVHKAIRGSDVPVKYLGELQLKNVDYPVKTYAIQSTGLPSPKINYKSTRKTRLFRLLTATTFLAVAIIAFLIFKNPGSNYNVVSDINTKSLVVLPLDNLSNDPSQNYFSDGMTEDITTKLCKISDLKITSRTSAMQYKKATKSLREIGSELGVNYIVEGSLRRIRDSLRISIQLIDAINDIHLWAEEYNRPFEDIFSLHSEIAAHIASHLKAEISPNEMKLLTQKPTDIIRAYDIYYKGQAAYNQYLSRYDQIDLENAEVFYRQALDLDANLAPALVGLAKCYVQRVNIFYDIQLLDSGLIMANNALANDTDFSEAYLVKGRILAMQGQNEESQKALNTAISLNPNGVSTMDILTYFAQLERRYDKALLYQLQAAELDPLTPSRHVSLALAYQDLDYFEKAEESVQNALQLQPDLVDAYTQWAFIYEDLGDIRKALSLNEKALSYGEENIHVLMFVGMNYSWLEDFEKANEYFNKALSLIEQAGAEQYPVYLFFSSRHAYILWEIGRKEEALDIINERYKVLNNEAEAQKIWMIGPGLSSMTYHHYKLGVANIFFYNKIDNGIKWLEKAVSSYGSWFSADYASNDPFFQKVKSNEKFQNVIRIEKERVQEQRSRVEQILKDKRLGIADISGKL